MSKSNIIPSLDGFRALAITIVFAGHARLFPGIPGGFGVTIFFFLSGFLITSLLIREYERYQSISFPAFFARRIVRLMPPLLATLALGTGLVLLGYVPGDLNLSTFASQIFFYYNYFHVYAETGTSIEGTRILWSLAVEEHFYLIWPGVFLLIARGWVGVRFMILLLFSILAWRAFRFYVWGDTEWMIYSFTDTRFDSLLFGCLLAILVANGTAERLFPQASRAKVLLLGGSLILIAIAFLIRDPAFRSTLRYSIQGTALMPIFYYAVTGPNTWLFRPLNWSPVRWVGVMSYTFYISHYIFIFFVKSFGLFEENYPLFLTLTLGITFLWSTVVHYGLERPLLPLRRRLTGHSSHRLRTSDKSLPSD
jgi:peptidoglycan/LPS O-acetylase OafA/YrhL